MIVFRTAMPRTKDLLDDCIATDAGASGRLIPLLRRISKATDAERVLCELIDPDAGTCLRSFQVGVGQDLEPLGDLGESFFLIV